MRRVPARRRKSDVEPRDGAIYSEQQQPHAARSDRVVREIAGHLAEKMGRRLDDMLLR